MGLPLNSRPPEALDRQARDLAVGGSASGGPDQARGRREAIPSLPAGEGDGRPARHSPVLALQCGPSTSRSASRARIYIPSRCPPPPSLSAPVRDAPRNLEPMRAARKWPDEQGCTDASARRRAGEPAQHPSIGTDAATDLCPAGEQRWRSAGQRGTCGSTRRKQRGGSCQPAARAPQHSPVPLLPGPGRGRAGCRRRAKPAPASEKPPPRSRCPGSRGSSCPGRGSARTGGPSGPSAPAAYPGSRPTLRCRLPLSEVVGPCRPCLPPVAARPPMVKLVAPSPAALPQKHLPG